MIERQAAQVVQTPRMLKPFSHISGKVQTGLVLRARQHIIAARLSDGRETIERPGGGMPVTQLLRECQAFLEISTRSLKICLLAGNQPKVPEGTH